MLLKKDVVEFIIGIGGSATNDAGTGMLSALGYVFLDENGNELEPNGENLINIRSFKDDKVMKEVAEAKFLIACDVR